MDQTMKKILLSIFLLGLTGILYAVSATQIGSVVRLQYTEPTNTAADVNGTTYPLTDLAYTSLYYQVAGTTFGVLCGTIPASSVTGGQLIKANCVVPTIKGVFTYTFWATATDLVGNFSAPSNTISVTVDELAPAAPQ